MKDSRQDRKDSNQEPKLPPGGGRMLLMRNLLWFLILLSLGFFWYDLIQGPERERISYTQFKQEVRQGKVAEVTLQGREVAGVYGEPGGEDGAKAEGEPQGEPPQQFESALPVMDDPELLALLQDNNVTVHVEPQASGWWAQALIGLLPFLLLVGLIVYANRRMQQQMGGGGPGGLFQFGKSKAKKYSKGPSEVKFDDVAGLENAKRDLREIVEYLKDPGRYQKLGAKLPRGILLLGTPGTGKTMLARATAGEANVPFFSISGSEFIEMFVGVGASRVRDMFETAKREAPAVIFIDEIDSVGRSRGTGLGGGHDEREQTLNQILSEMDGFTPEHAVVVLAATNRPDVLDPALLRPGRFDRKVRLDPPRKDARREILEVHVRKVGLADDVDLEALARRTVGFSGADLENLVNEAALLAGRERKQRVDMQSFEQARDKIVLGAKRETLLDEEEKRRVAFHESGHALLTCLLPHTDPLEKVTIIPRGRALGVTEQMPEEERFNLTESYLKDRITVMLGGRVSEKLVFGEVSSGAEDDLQQATALARRMVGRWGMSERLGPVAFRRDEDHVFLGREMTQPRDFSEHSARLIDEEVRALISGLEQKAFDLLRDHQDRLERFAEALLEKEVLEAEEIRQLVEREQQPEEVQLND